MQLAFLQLTVESKSSHRFIVHWAQVEFRWDYLGCCNCCSVALAVALQWAVASADVLKSREVRKLQFLKPQKLSKYKIPPFWHIHFVFCHLVFIKDTTKSDCRKYRVQQRELFHQFHRKSIKLTMTKLLNVHSWHHEYVIATITSFICQ